MSCQNGLWNYYLLSGSFYLNFHSLLFTEEMALMHVHSLLYCWPIFISSISLLFHFISCISLGNHIYDSVTTGMGRYFSVREETPFLGLITGNVQLEDSFDIIHPE